MKSEELNFDDCKLVVICEGNSEKTYVDFMLDNEMLVFSRENLLTEEPLGNKYRKGETFTKDFLTMTFEKPLIILLIQDDATKFKVKKPYDEKIGEIHYVVTAPEIEMLMIIHKRLQDRYKKQKKEALNIFSRA